MSQEIEYVLDGQTSSFDDRLAYHDLGIKRDPLKQLLILHRVFLP
jgi:hypothetical protein